MPSVLTAASTVQCVHQGVVASTPSTKLFVQGSGVLLATSLTSVTPPTCTNVPPPASRVPCTTVTVTAGTATKLTVGGVPVLLDTLVGTTTSQPVVGTVSATANQTILTAV